MTADYRQARYLLEKYRDRFPDELTEDMDFPNQLIERWREYYTQTLPLLHKHSPTNIPSMSNRILVELVLGDMTLQLENLLTSLIVKKYPDEKERWEYQQALADKANSAGICTGLHAIEYFIDILLDEEKK